MRAASPIRSAAARSNAPASPNGCEHAVLTVHDMLARGRVVEGHDRQAACHGLDGDVAERLGDAGEQEHIRRGIVAGQILVGAHAGENMLGVQALHAGTLRSVTDQHEPRPRPALAHRGERRQDQRQVLLRRNAPDVGDDRVAVLHAPLPAQRATAACRIEQARVDAARHDFEPAITLALELRTQLAGGDEGAQRAVVKAPEIATDDMLEKSRHRSARCSCGSWCGNPWWPASPCAAPARARTSPAAPPSPRARGPDASVAKLEPARGRQAVPCAAPGSGAAARPSRAALPVAVPCGRSHLGAGAGAPPARDARGPATRPASCRWSSPRR